MKASAYVMLLILIHCFASYLPPDRIKIQAVIPTENTGQIYSAWLNDNLDSLITNVWEPANFRYVDVKLQLESRSSISKVSLYDYEGVFNDNPATIYALDGNQKTLIGTFTGARYKEFVDLVPQEPITADAIIIHKYCNNIPQKIRVFGNIIGKVTAPAIPSSVLQFNDLPSVKAGSAAFRLLASSNNTGVPVTYSVDNNAVIKLINSNGAWFALPVSPGTARITAQQGANGNFSAATPVTRTVSVLDSNSVSVPNQKIPIDPKRWFQLTNATNGNEALFDGDTVKKVETGWGKILDNYDHYYPVLNGERIDLQAIRMFDGEGDAGDKPFTISVINSDGQKINVARFNGSAYNKWVGPDPQRSNDFKLPSSFNNIKYIVLNSWNFFPTEIEFIGNYSSGPAKGALQKTAAHLKHMFGVNGFEWNFEAPLSPGSVEPRRFAAAKSFTGFRHYMDWEKLESLQGLYSFNPTISGGWNYDAIYDSCKAAGIEVLACLKTLPAWLLNTYPSNERDIENVPAAYGSDLSNPASYIQQARVAFQFAARYGVNKSVDPSLIKLNTQPRWANDKVNEKKIGLGSVKYIECENERDKWWKGRKAYQTAFEYAANLSAFYDGHKNTLGKGVGVKNADPSMLVVMGGTALASTDYLKGMIDWCRRFRGYKADGSVNICWDVINYHYYSNDSRSSQNGQATRGAAPEISGATEIAAEFLRTSYEYGNNLPVWVSELGYDANQGSAFKAIPIGSKSALETQADWILRSALLYARTGIERIFFYGMYDDNLANPLQFSSSGLINENSTRKPAADFIYQVSKTFGEYKWIETKSTSPVVDVYESNGKYMYMIVVPDEKGITMDYKLDLAGTSYARVYKPAVGKNEMDVEVKQVHNGKLSVTASETPVFIVADGTIKTAAVGDAESLSAMNVQRMALDKSIQVYPNPTVDNIQLVINNPNKEKITVTIYEAGSGKTLKQVSYSKTDLILRETIDVGEMTPGYFILEIRQGKTQVSRKILKQS